MFNLAKAYQEGKKLDQAISLFQETRQRQEAALGPDDSDTLTTMNSLAIAYQEAQRLDLALPLFEKTLALRKAKLGPDNPDTIISMNNLAVAYYRAKRLDKSIPLFEESLRRAETKPGRDHPTTQMTVANLGVNYMAVGRLKEAIPPLEEAHRAAKKFPELRWVFGNLLEAYTKAGENAKATSLLLEQLANARKSLPKSGPEIASQLSFFGPALIQSRAYTEAESVLRELLSIREKSEPDAWSTFNTRSVLGGALLGQKKFADAEPLLLQGYEGMKFREKTIPPTAATRIPEALDRLIELYTATNKPDEVKKWRAELDKYPAPVEKGPLPREKK